MLLLLLLPTTTCDLIAAAATTATRYYDRSKTRIDLRSSVMSENHRSSALLAVSFTSAALYKMGD